MAKPRDSIVIRGYFAQPEGPVPRASYEKRYTVYGDDGKEAGPMTMQMEGDYSRSTVDTPWGKVGVTYDRRRSMSFEITKDDNHLADAMQTTRKPIIVAFSEERKVVFKQKPFKLKLVSKNNFGTYEIEYGQLSGGSLLTSLPKGEGYRRWRISVLGESLIDNKTFFTVLGAFTCHVYELLWPDYPNTLESLRCFPVGD